jgi:hypothetical protein
LRFIPLADFFSVSQSAVLASAGRYCGLNIGFADVSLRRNFVLASPKLRFGFAETSFSLPRLST